VRKIKAKTKVSVIVGVALLISFIAIFLSPKFVKSQESFCGNMICEPDEDIYSCPQDCPGYCGDGICNYWYEGYALCPQDCPGYCGDGICDPTENYNYCPSDCPAPSYTEITGCTQITSPGEYRLVSDIIDSGASKCINIQADNVILDCQGHIIDGNDTSGSNGIYDDYRINVTIKNCIVTDWYYGIYFDSSNSNTLSNIIANSNYFGIFLYNSNSTTLSNITANSNIDGIHLYNSYFNILSDITSNSNSGSGIFLESSNSNTLSNIIANFNIGGYGIFLYNSNSNTLSNITSNSNERGIYLRESNSNIIKGSMFQNNYYGIYLYDSSMNLIYDNLFNSIYNVYFGASGANYWNTTLTQGTNIVGGPYIGGNYWGSPDGTGFSDTCSDSNNDGICDNPYTLAADNIDYLPLAKYVGSLPAPSYTEISSCMQITEPGEYRLVNDIIDQNVSECIGINSNDVILDCQGHTIDGVGWGKGIWAGDITNLTIKNCIIKEWQYAIWVDYLRYSNIINNTIDGTIHLEFYTTQTSNITYNKIGSIESEASLNLSNNVISYGGYLDVAFSILYMTNNIFNGGTIILGANVGRPQSNTYFYNNIFNGTSIYFSNPFLINYWNTTLQPENNIWNSSLGYIGGNLWTTPDNNGYSDTCVDANYDGFCDDPYELLDGSNIDYLPLAKYVGQS
jgi:parallel beta-helix repeat protein